MNQMLIIVVTDINRECTTYSSSKLFHVETLGILLGSDVGLLLTMLTLLKSSLMLVSKNGPISLSSLQLGEAYGIL